MNLLIDVDEPQLLGRLTLFPIRSSAPEAPEYLTGPEADESRTFAVRELDGVAEVAALVVTNQAPTPLLFIEGETLLGTKQNRTLNVSVLCGAGSDTTVPVSCVEAGRWGAPQGTSRSPRHAPNRLRADKTGSVVRALESDSRLSDQGEVWANVDAYALNCEVDAPTNALEDVFEAAAPSVEELLAGVRPIDGQRGVAVGIGGRIASLDVFDKESTLLAYWDGLLAGYALDALAAEDRPALLADAKAFVARMTAASVDVSAGVGLGDDLRLRGPDLVGLGLSWQNTVVHLAAFHRDDRERRIRPIIRDGCL